jgi:hypothetical protein
MLPTVTPVPTSTPVYRPSPTPSSTATPTRIAEVQRIPPLKTAVLADPTESPLEAFIVQLGDLQSVTDGGFSFRTIEGYKTEVLMRRATLTSAEGDVVVSLSGVPVHSVGDLHRVMEQFLEKIRETISQFSSGAPYTVAIDGDSGLAADVRGAMGGERISGRVLIVAPNDERLFYALAISINGPSGRGWETKGQPVFESVIGTINFLETGEE